MNTENTIKFNYWLSPISFFYRIGIGVRNFLFDKNILPKEEFPIPVICIGNLSVGGTGKTPHTEYLINLLKENYKVAVLSRGYKRKTKGFILASDKSSCSTIGDEPYQIKLKFPDLVVAVDEDRRRGIKKLLALEEELRPDIILLDDAYQHRYVQPSLSIVLTDYNRLFYEDKLLPVGRLRESPHAIRRADVVIITKCDSDIKPIDTRIIESNCDLLAHQLSYFTTITYGELKPVFPTENREETAPIITQEDEIVVVSGIAKPELFLNEIKKYTNNSTVFTYPDHYNFKKGDLSKIQAAFNKIEKENKFILTTEKDAARLKDSPYVPEELKKYFYYLPITIDFCLQKNQNKSFDEMIKHHISRFKLNIIK